MSELQATVRDAGPDGGTLVRDDGRTLPWARAVLDPSLVDLHPGQRVRARLEAGEVTALTLVGLPFT